jgi:2-polyprenyl-6-methoxyphenol hydroxylase-like FAD-dependent oxidoreductase
MIDVLIIGAGPTGLVLAMWLTKQGVKVRIIDKSSGPGETSRAMAVQARTLELYRQLGIADAVVAAGHVTGAMNIWARGKQAARIVLTQAGTDVTPYPFMLIFPQDLHERLLIDRLRELGIEVERQTEFLTFEDNDDHIVARLKMPNGGEEIIQARYLSGCDGARSPVRHQIGSGFDGGTYKQLFYVADAQVSGLEPASEAHIALDKADFVACLSYGRNGLTRLIGTVWGDGTDNAENLSFDDVGHTAIEGLGLTVNKVNWFSTYHVHHRVTDHFQRGRVFLLGDAAHVHSPAGGQGMNTGIADAINLAWKLAAVLKGRAQDRLLESYEAERQVFAKKLVETTDRVFTFATAEGSFADFVRTHVFPTVASVAYKSDNVREFMFRLISQTSLGYRASPVSQGKAGDVHGGDRLPWVSAPGMDNYESLAAIAWQIHVYGEARPDLKEWCNKHGVALHEFAWQPEHRKAGFAQDAAYLLRPDSYVAFADPTASPGELARYVHSQGLTFG